MDKAKISEIASIMGKKGAEISNKRQRAGLTTKQYGEMMRARRMTKFGWKWNKTRKKIDYPNNDEVTN